MELIADTMDDPVIHVSMVVQGKPKKRKVDQRENEHTTVNYHIQKPIRYMSTSTLANNGPAWWSQYEKENPDSAKVTLNFDNTMYKAYVTRNRFDPLDGI